MNISKLDKLKTALQKGDNKTAFSIARKFFFGIDKNLKESIEIASDAISNKPFYLSLGVDIEHHTNLAVNGLKSKFLA